MTRHGAGIAVVVFVAAATAAALTDGLTHTSTRPMAAALVEGLPALVLAVATGWSAGRGARLFALAMLALAFGVVATSGVKSEGTAMVLVVVFVASALLALAFVRSASIIPNRSRAVALALAPLVALAGVLVTVAIVTGRSVSSTRCGVDNCAYPGLGAAFALGAAFELALLAVTVAALGADMRAGTGAALFAVGLNMLLLVAPAWSQYQGIAGVAVGYAGLGLAALPWLMPRRAKGANVSLPAPQPAL